MRKLTKKLKLLIIIFAISFIGLKASNDGDIENIYISKSEVVFEVMEILDEIFPGYFEDNYILEINGILYEKPIEMQNWMTEPFEIEPKLEVEDWMTKPFKNESKI